jgi:WD40 repeat protein
MRSYGLRTLLLYLVASLAACDAGSDGQTGLYADPGSSASNVNSLNGGLSGKLVTTISSNPLQLFDLSSGTYEPMRLSYMPDIMAERGEPIYSSFSILAFNRTAPESGFVQSFFECYKDYIYHNSCVAVLAADGSVRKILRTEGELNHEAKLSPDGNFIAMNEFYEVSGPTDSYLQIRNTSDFDTTHEIKLRSSNNHDGKAVVEWGAAGELYYTNSTDQQAIIYVTKPYTLETAHSITLPDQYTGEIESLDISPDGKKLLIGYDPAALNAVSTGSIFLLDLETRTLTVPAIDHRDAGVQPLGDDVAGNVHSAAWSPDGQWILVLHGWYVSTGGYADPLELPQFPEPSGRGVRRMFAVPADGEYTELGKTAEEISTQAILLFNVESDTNVLSDEWSGGKVIWLDY